MKNHLDTHFRPNPLVISLCAALILAACGGGGSDNSAALAEQAAAQAAAVQAAQTVTTGKVSAAAAISDGTLAELAKATTAADAAEAEAAKAAAAGATTTVIDAAYKAAIAQAALATGAAAEAARLLRAQQTVAASTTDTTVASYLTATVANKAAADAASTRATRAAQAALASLTARDAAAAVAYVAGARGLVFNIDFQGDDVLKPVSATALNATVAQGAFAGTRPTYTLSVKNGSGVQQWGQIFTGNKATLDGYWGVNPDQIGELGTTPTTPANVAATPREMVIHSYATSAGDATPSYAKLAVWKEDRYTGGVWNGFTKGIVPFGTDTPTNLSFLNVSVPASFKGGTSMAGRFSGGSYQPDQAGKTEGVDGYAVMNVNFVDRTVVFATIETEQGSDYNIAPTILTWDNTLKAFVGSVTTKAGLTGSVRVAFYGPTAQEAAGVIQLQAATGFEMLATGFLARTYVPTDADEQAQIPCATKGSITVIPSTCR